MKTLDLLLIDDSEADYEIIKHKLESLSSFEFTLDWVSNYEEGKVAINSRKYDLILLDANLGDGDGIELLKFARERSNKKPIIIITGVSDPEYDLAALKQGADDYIVKTDLGDTSLERSIRYSYERYLTKLKVSQREERYRNLFEKSLNAISIIDKDYEILEANQSFASLFELKISEIIGKAISDFFTSPHSFNNFREIIDNWGIVKKHRVTLLSASKAKIFAEVSVIVLFDLDNSVSGYQVIIKDLTKERRGEQRLIRAEKLGMTGRIARSIAHEVRNPLTNINLAIDQLKEDIPNNESNLMYIDIINRNSNRINKLITELLNSSKPSTAIPVKQSIKKVIKEAILLAKDRLSLNDIELIEDYDNDHNILYDSIQLKTALLNIIINAIEAMEEVDGVLRICLISQWNEIQIKISDNGKGMAKETLNQLFDPFFTGKSSGMGLGMTSTQNIIQQHNGNIDVESEEGVGTTFIISLPK